MLNKDQRRNDAHYQARQEEARLLGGVKDYKYVVRKWEWRGYEFTLMTDFADFQG